MSYIRKSLSNVLVSIMVVMAAAAIAIWQFYRFATFSDVRGIVDMQGGTAHLWWAIVVFSVFLRQEKEDVIHITS
jgi:predicted transcriptional regulator